MSSSPSPIARRRQQGLTTMEMALLLPMLIALLLGIIEAGNLLRTQLTLNNAAMIVARQVAVDPTVRTQAAATAFMVEQNLVPLVTQTSAGATAPLLSLTPENPTCSLSETCVPFELTVSYSYRAIVTPLMEPFFDGVALAATVQKTAEPGTGTRLVSE